MFNCLELAGELKQAYPVSTYIKVDVCLLWPRFTWYVPAQKKKVTLVHRDKLLLNPAYPDKYRKDIERRTRARGIDIILGDEVEDLTESVSGVTTKHGRSIPDADLLVSPLALALCCYVLT